LADRAPSARSKAAWILHRFGGIWAELASGNQDKCHVMPMLFVMSFGVAAPCGGHPAITIKMTTTTSRLNGATLLTRLSSIVVDLATESGKPMGNCYIDSPSGR
jgi:hypothetical protein